jgi:hypothetical protein
VEARLPLPAAARHAAGQRALGAAARAVDLWSGRSLLAAWRIQAQYADADEPAVAAARRGLEFTSANGMRGQQLVFQALLAERLARQGDCAQAAWLARDSWRLMAEFSSGMVYRGVVWRALIDVLQPHDEALARTIAHDAADWIFRTAADHVPLAFRDSFLQRNPINAALLGKVRAR